MKTLEMASNLLMWSLFCWPLGVAMSSPSLVLSLTLKKAEPEGEVDGGRSRRKLVSLVVGVGG